MVSLNLQMRSVGTALCTSTITAVISGCGQDRYESTASGLSAGVVVVFLFAWGMTLLISKMHDSVILKATRDKCRSVVKFLGVPLMLIGLGLSFLGFLSDGLTGIFFYVGGVVVVMGRYLQQWSITPSLDEAKLNMKIVGLCVTVVIALLWLMFFGRDVLRF
jgi:hypothetical protein